MSTKRTYHYYRPGDLSGLEYSLNAMSRAGWQAVKPGRFVQRYRREEGVFVHRFGCSAHRPGSADEIAWLAAQQRAGWEVAARRKGWVLFRKEAAGDDAAQSLPLEGKAAPQGPDELASRQTEASEQPTLVGHRETVEALFKGRVARMEAFRRWMLVLAALLLIGGYMSSLLPILYSTALPLLAAAFVTYRIKWMEEGLKK